MKNESILVPELETGEYEHYKGNRYEVIAVAVNEEDLTPVVVYKPLYKSEVEYWARTYSVFTEILIIDGVETPRFKKI
jgi:hypothetical protein